MHRDGAPLIAFTRSTVTSSWLKTTLGIGPQAAVMLIDERPCIRCALCVDWCPTECLTMDHFRLTPAPERESVDLAVVAD